MLSSDFFKKCWPDRGHAAMLGFSASYAYPSLVSCQIRMGNVDPVLIRQTKGLTIIHDYS